MAKRRTYGNTWWGATWLRALESVDHSNRLPRGRTYCNTGHIASCEWHPETRSIEALVDGSAYYPYEVTIALPPLPEKKAEALLNAIAKDPVLVAELLDGTLSPAVADLAENLGIELFPKSWRSMKLACSCPDSARVCKHIAAVFYALADLIDADPFLIFKLHGLDLRGTIQARGINLADTVSAKPLSLEALLAEATADRPVPPQIDEDAALAKLRTIRYGELDNMRATLEKLLPERIDPGMKENFRSEVLRMLDASGRALRRTLELCAFEAAAETVANTDAHLASEDGLRDVRTNWPQFLEKTLARSSKAHATIPPENARLGFEVRFSAEAGLAVAVTRRSRPPRARKDRIEHFDANPGSLFTALLALPAVDARRLAPEVECWREITMAAARLIEKAALVPALILPEGIEEPMPRILWTPAMRSRPVATLFDALAASVIPFAPRLFPNNALPDLSADAARSDSRKAVFLALICAITGLLLGTYAEKAQARVSSLYLLAALGGDIRFADGRFPAAAERVLTRKLRAFLLGEAYPWLPVLTARVRTDGVKLNFGILGRGVTPKALEAPDSTDPIDDSDEAQAALRSSEATSIPQPPHPAEAMNRYRTDRPVMLSTLLKENRYANDRFAALSILKTLGEAYPALEEIREKGGKPITLAAEDLKEFLFEAAPVLTLLGVSVMLPEKLKRLLKPRLVASLDINQKSTGSLLGRNALSNFDWKVALGGRELTADEIKALISHAGEVVQIGDDFVYVDPNEIAAIARAFENPRQPTYLERMRAALTGEFHGAEVEASKRLLERLQKLTEVETVPVPADLNATLRPYQVRGFAWLMKNLRLGMGALIADDMGLGKTLQVIAAIDQLKLDGELRDARVLAVVPTTLMTNWLREIAKFAPSLKVGLYHGPQRKLPLDPSTLPDILITSYGTMRRDIEKLSALKWRLLVLDEAQAIKNASSAQAQSVRLIGAPQTIAMTGTPVENRLMEYWSIINTVQPQLLGSAEDFQRTFAMPIEADHDPQAADAFRRLTAPFMLRRLKTDKSIISDLPERNTIDQFVTLTPEQAGLYGRVLERHLERLKSLDRETMQEGTGKDESANVLDDEEKRRRRRGEVLKLIMSLKQICNSPSQYQKTQAPYPDSGKGAALFDILDRCKEADRKVLIFTQFREMGERLQQWIERATGERPDFLHGGVTIANRQKMVDRFQNDRTVRTLIVSLKAGGTGLNLTAASAVIHYDLWWNPAVEAQATDRAYRIGQRRDVIVWRFVCAGTFEERINDMLAAKRSLADLTVATGETWIGDLSTKEIEKMFSLGANPEAAAEAQASS